MLESHSCHKKEKIDIIFYSSSFGVSFFYLLHWFFLPNIESYTHLAIFAGTIFDLLNTVWWGIAIGILMISVISVIPREFVLAILGEGGSLKGICRATIAGVLLDLCSHGILMVGAKLYERGASIGQVMAFLIASPWNSFSLTLIMAALIGIKWTILFIILSMFIAIITGLVFDHLVRKKILPENPNKVVVREDFYFWKEAKYGLSKTKYNYTFLKKMITSGLAGSRIIVKWIFFGIIISALIKTFIDTHLLKEYFGPSAIGLALTILAATIIEVCSEGSTPIAADLLNRAQSPGNSFAFLMSGVSTDYTEILIIKETTKSWKVALFLPLISLPQIVSIGWILNH